jgi:glycosyltransferase involved in cell wall biosynthesis
VSNIIKLWKISNIVLRPTFTDGDSLVVREALSVGTCVIASDIVERPVGTILFECGNFEQLAMKILENLSSRIEIKPEISNNYEEIKTIYSTLIKSSI